MPPSRARLKRLLTALPRGKRVAKATTLSRVKWKTKKKSKLKSAKEGGGCSETVNVITEQEYIYFP